MMKPRIITDIRPDEPGDCSSCGEELEHGYFTTPHFGESLKCWIYRTVVADDKYSASQLCEYCAEAVLETVERHYKDERKASAAEGRLDEYLGRIKDARDDRP